MMHGVGNLELDQPRVLRVPAENPRALRAVLHSPVELLACLAFGLYTVQHVYMNV